jgi:hypothetical protein
MWCNLWFCTVLPLPCALDSLPRRGWTSGRYPYLWIVWISRQVQYVRTYRDVIYETTGSNSGQAKARNGSPAMQRGIGCRPRKLAELACAGLALVDACFNTKAWRLFCRSGMPCEGASRGYNVNLHATTNECPCSYRDMASMWRQWRAKPGLHSTLDSNWEVPGGRREGERQV